MYLAYMFIFLVVLKIVLSPYNFLVTLTNPKSSTPLGCLLMSLSQISHHFGAIRNEYFVGAHIGLTLCFLYTCFKSKTGVTPAWSPNTIGIGLTLSSPGSISRPIYILILILIEYILITPLVVYNLWRENIPIEIIVINLSGINIIIITYFKMLLHDERIVIGLTILHVLTFFGTGIFLGRRWKQFKRMGREPSPAVAGFTFPVGELSAMEGGSSSILKYISHSTFASLDAARDL